MSRRAGAGCHLILGPMFSGKSTQLLSELVLFGHAHLKSVLVLHSGDLRFAEPGTHSGLVFAAALTNMDCRIVRASFLADVVLLPDERVVAVDEGQFFLDLRTGAEEWLANGRTVLIAALNGDFMRRPFGPVSEVLPLASSVELRNAVCCCRPHKWLTDAPFSVRTVEGGEQRLVGGADEYVAACGACFDTGAGVRGALVAVEGIDGAGKSRLIESLVADIRSLAADIRSLAADMQGVICVLRFPERAPGSALAALLDGELVLPPLEAHALFAADRWKRVREIRECLERRQLVVCDRYALSGLVYSVAAGADPDICAGFDAGLPAPDLTLLVDTLPETAAAREAARDGCAPRAAQLDKLRRCYLQVLHTRGAGGKWARVDGERGPDEMAMEAMRLVSPLLLGVRGLAQRMWR